MTARIVIEDLMHHQAGVIARSQVLECGRTPADIRRKLRRREWASPIRGIYVDHTGPLSWRQRAWVAVLDAWPAALSHTSALCAATGGSEPGPIHVAVDGSRHRGTPPGVVIHRRRHLTDHVLWHTSPPRIRVEDALLDVAESVPTRVRVIACLADAVQARQTTPRRLLAAVDNRNRLRWRAFLVGVLQDIDDGTCSVLEHEYLTRVERRHRLPTPDRQRPTTAGRRGFRDIEYPHWHLVVELDGRLAHDTATARDRDLERDLDAAVSTDARTIRLGWGQVVDRPCVTAHKIALLLRRQGWAGNPTHCPDCPPPTPR
ncbi:MAG: hypothetical protein QM662_10450 [Gordonia sp. (in: high G+C Gram-positive bacteria)]